jgi:hypothetical protein
VKHFPEQTVVAAWRRESWASRRGERKSRARWVHMSSTSPRRPPTLVPHTGQGAGDWRQRWSWPRVGMAERQAEGRQIVGGECRRVL